MANKKFSEFTSQTDSANVQFVVGYNGSDNVRISPGNLLGAYLPLAGGTMTGNIVLNDNVKSIYGTASDGLEIFHDANDSYIKDNGTGVLYIQGSGNVQIEGVNGENMAIFNENGSVQLHYDNVQKFQTTTSGVSVDGAVTVKSGNKLILNRPNDGIDCELSTDAAGTLLLNSRNAEGFQFQNGGATFLTLDSTGATSFAGSASSTTAVASIQHLSSNGYLYIKGGTGGIIIGDDSTASRIQIEDNSNIRFETAGSERMRIDSSGVVTVGAQTATRLVTTLTENDKVDLNVTDGANTARNLTFSSGGAEKMRVDSSGNVLFGTTGVPNGTSIYGAGFIPEADDRSTLFLSTSRSTAAALMIFFNPNGTVGSISTSGTSTSFNTSSDYRLKEDLKDFDGLDKVSKIPVYDFKWKTDDNRSYGVMAHELQDVLPQAVSGDKDAKEMQSVDYSKIVPLLIKSIQELKAEVQSLKNK